MRLDRRRFLLGLGGVAVALPFLESLHVPRASAGPDRFRFAFFVRGGNGVAQEQRSWIDGMEQVVEAEQFWPHELGSLDALGTRDADRATSELAAFASRLNLVRGVNRPFNTPSCGHSDSIVQLLTSASIVSGSSNDAAALGPSLDWRIASQLNAPGRDPMTLMAGPTDAYIKENLSWRGANERTPAERSPLNQYMRMMGITSAPPEIQERILTRQNSVNDLVRDELQSLLSRRDLGALDRRRLQQHMEAIRDTELSLLSCESMDPMFMSRLAEITDVEGNDVRTEVVKRHMEVLALAASCQYTHAGTLQVGEGNDQTQYEIDGTRLPRFHWISHRIYSDGAEGETIPDAVTLHHQVDRLQLSLFRHLLERLDMFESPYGGTVLDDGVCVWVNDLSNGPPHGGENVPWVLAGSAGGRLRTGQYVDAGGVDYNRILNTIGAAVGCTKDDGSPLDDFGDASLTPGRIDALVAG